VLFEASDFVRRVNNVVIAADPDADDRGPPTYYIPSNAELQSESQAESDALYKFKIRVQEGVSNRVEGPQLPIIHNLTTNRLQSLREQSLISKKSDLVYIHGDKESVYVQLTRVQMQNCIDSELNGEAYSQISTKEAKVVTTLACRKLRVAIKTGFEAGFIDKELKSFLMNTVPQEDGNARTARLLVTAKTHKGISKGAPNPIKFRVIISNVKVAARRAQEYIAKEANEAMRASLSFVEDTAEAVHRIERTLVPPWAKLCTADVRNFYPEANRQECLDDSFGAWVRTYGGAKAAWMRDLNDLVSSNIVFTDDRDRFWAMKDGFAIGLCHAAQMCNISFGFIEEDVMVEAMSRGLHIPEVYIRQQDDIFFTYGGSNSDLVEFQSLFADKLGSKRVLEWESSTHSANWCDITVYKGVRFSRSGVLDLKLFVKPTDSGKKLHFASYHPLPTKVGILKGEAHRLLIACSGKAEWMTAINTKMVEYTNAGYPLEILVKNLQDQLDFEDRANLLATREAKREAKRTSAPPQAKTRTMAWRLEHTPREKETKLQGLVQEAHQWALEDQVLHPFAKRTRFVAAWKKGKSVGEWIKPF
jgi:hypothetical protein